MTFNANIFGGSFNTLLGSEMGVFNAGIFNNEVFNTGEVTPPIPTPVAATAGGGSAYYGKPSYKKKRFAKRLDELIDADVAYAQLLKTDAREAAIAIVRPLAKTEAAIPQPKQIDWKRLREDQAKALMHLWLMREDEELLLL